MAEVKAHIARPRISAPIGGIPRTDSPNITRNIEKIATPLIEGIVGALTSGGNNDKAQFFFKLSSDVNKWALTKNIHEVAKLRDSALLEAGPDGRDLITPEEMFSAQANIRPEFTIRRVKNKDGSVSSYDSNQNLMHTAPPPDSSKSGRTEQALGRTIEDFEYNEKIFPLTAQTLKVQLIDPHLPDPNNPDPIQATKHKKLMKASKHFSDSLARVGRTVDKLIDKYALDRGSDVSELDPINRAEDNRERLFVVLEAATLELEAMNQFSQEGLGGPAQIAPITVFNAMKSEVFKLLIEEEASDAFGGLKEIREFFDDLESDIDKSALDAIALSKDATLAKEVGFIENRFKLTRNLRKLKVEEGWSDTFFEMMISAQGLSFMATASSFLIKSGQPYSVKKLAEVATNQLMGPHYDRAINDILSFGTDPTVSKTEIFAAMDLAQDSYLSTIDSRRMIGMRDAIKSLLDNPKINFKRNSLAKKRLIEILSTKFSGPNMAKAETLAPTLSELRKARDKKE